MLNNFYPPLYACILNFSSKRETTRITAESDSDETHDPESNAVVTAVEPSKAESS